MNTKPELKNKSELDKLTQQVETLRETLEIQNNKNKSLEDKVKSFEELKKLMPETIKGIAECRKEPKHPSLHYKLKEKYSCIKTKDQMGAVWFILKVTIKTPTYREVNTGETKTHVVEGYGKTLIEYKYHPPSFYRYFNWLPEEGDPISGDEFIKELRKKQKS